LPLLRLGEDETITACLSAASNEIIALTLRGKRDSKSH
jgi:hypothetical protein